MVKSEWAKNSTKVLSKVFDVVQATNNELSFFDNFGKFNDSLGKLIFSSDASKPKLTLPRTVLMDTSIHNQFIREWSKVYRIRLLDGSSFYSVDSINHKGQKAAKRVR